MRGAALNVLIVLAGCAGDAGAGGESRNVGEARVSISADAVVVARVGQQAITRAQVREVAAQTSLDEREALSALVEETLLAQAASKRGYGEDPEVQQQARRASVHALLAARVEGAETPASLPEAAVRERYEQWRERAHEPPRRRADHILFVLPNNATSAQESRARRLAETAIEALRSVQDLQDLQSVLERYEGLGSEEGLQVKVERLPAVAQDGTLQAPFEQALFDLDEPGVVPDPVRTDYGWHAVVVQEVIAGKGPSYEQVEARLRETLLNERRHDRLQKLLRELREDSQVQYFEQNIARVLSAAEGGS